MMSKFAVFDIDGTLIRWQLYHAVIERLAKYGLLGKGAHQKIKDARMIWKRREHADAFRQYEKAVIAAYEAALPNLKVAEFTKVAKEVAKEYRQQTYAYTRELATELKKKGYVLLAISGSHQELVEQVGRQYNFDDYLGTQFLHDNGRYTGKQVFFADDKAQALKMLIEKHNLSLRDSYGVGDSASDIPMLEMVENPIAFNPNRELFDEARRRGWPIVIERKNVIYELSADSTGAYHLD